MGKKPKKSSGNVSLPPGSDLPPDEDVIVPHQVKYAAAVANALAASKPVPPKPETTPRARFPHNDAEIDEALRRLRQGRLQLGDPEFKVIYDLAEAGAQHIKSRRLGAQRPRENSDLVTRRLEAELEAYRELSSKRQRRRVAVKEISRNLEKLGLHVSEATINKDLKALAPLLRLVREGKLPPPGGKPINKKLSKQTQREMVAGKRRLAKHRSGR